jgi:hypothetical protein
MNTSSRGGWTIWFHSQSLYIVVKTIKGYIIYSRVLYFITMNQNAKNLYNFQRKGKKKFCKPYEKWIKVSKNVMQPRENVIIPPALSPFLKQIIPFHIRS